jgi:hypothetical protein
MDTKTLIDTKNDVIKKHGDWTAHNICLNDGVYTIAPKIVGDEVKLRRIVQCVFDLAGGSVEGLRILDLACLEGLYAIEFARHNAKCVGIEGREANIAKARFTKEALRLDNLDLFQDDVRNLSEEKYGRFDVVLCLGLLYHLDAPDVFQFIEKLSEVSASICIVDTRIALSPNAHYTYRDKVYSGLKGEEHHAGESREAKTAKLWASLDNNQNFWLSRATLYNALSHAGFTTVYECNVPAEPDKPPDRITVVAIKGRKPRILSAPLMAGQPLDDMPERPRRENSVAVDSVRRISAILPRKIRQAGKALVGRDNKLT